MLKSRDSKQTVLKLVSYHPIKTLRLDLHRLMRTRCKIILIPSKEVHFHRSSQMGTAMWRHSLKSKHTGEGMVATLPSNLSNSNSDIDESIQVLTLEGEI